VDHDRLSIAHSRIADSPTRCTPRILLFEEGTSENLQPDGLHSVSG
jgi:hypothetical protein